jgi:peptidoglycan/LPS O-acetylase OafA/YrhL
MRSPRFWAAILGAVNFAVAIVVIYFWTSLTQDSQFLAALLVSGDIGISVEVFRFLSNDGRKQRLNRYYMLRVSLGN